MFDGYDSDANPPCVALNDLRCGVPLPDSAGKFISLEGLTKIRFSFAIKMAKELLSHHFASSTRDAEVAKVCFTYTLFNVAPWTCDIGVVSILKGARVWLLVVMRSIT